ncbi:hypothetical protein RRG08_057466 [Elysia crispata]|uniref:Uncharacterized protein n=1 Tax=Elysia crispata TaxID=231223 RepID=A0AAE0YDK5_9GAST|nr:hypothetical protein RRG08_057466 [Elysia crispata]
MLRVSGACSDLFLRLFRGDRTVLRQKMEVFTVMAQSPSRDQGRLPELSLIITHQPLEGQTKMNTYFISRVGGLWAS